MLSDEVLSVVLDIGSLYARAGFSGEDAPRYHSTSKVGEYVGSMQIEEGTKRYAFGDEGLHRRRDNFEIRDSITNGLINADWYTALIDNCYHQLHVEPKEYSVLVANNMANK
jgi:actin beta/gamma 1/actin-like protein 6A